MASSGRAHLSCEVAASRGGEVHLPEGACTQLHDSEEPSEVAAFGRGFFCLAQPRQALCHPRNRTPGVVF